MSGGISRHSGKAGLCHVLLIEMSLRLLLPGDGMFISLSLLLQGDRCQPHTTFAARLQVSITRQFCCKKSSCCKEAVCSAECASRLTGSPGRQRDDAETDSSRHTAWGTYGPSLLAPLALACFVGTPIIIGRCRNARIPEHSRTLKIPQPLNSHVMCMNNASKIYRTYMPCSSFLFS